MGFLCLVNMFTMRVSLHVAITEMVLESESNSTLDAEADGNTTAAVFVDPYACPDPVESASLGNNSNSFARAPLVPVSSAQPWRSAGPAGGTAPSFGIW